MHAADTTLSLYAVEGTEHPWVAYFQPHSADSNQQLIRVSIATVFNLHNATNVSSSKGTVTIPIPGTNLMIRATIRRQTPVHRPANLRTLGMYNVSPRYCTTKHSTAQYVLNLLWTLESKEYGGDRVGYYVNACDVVVQKRCKNAESELPGVTFNQPTECT